VIPRVALDAYVVLQDRPMNCKDIAAEVHCHVRTASRVLREMHEDGLLHVQSWQRSQGAHLPVYAFGPGEDAPKLPSLTDKERKARVKGKVSVEDRDFENARRRQLRRKIKIDPLTAAFFGGR
jgi:transposase